VSLPRGGLLALLPALLLSCSLVSLKQMRVTGFPSERNQLISRADRIRLGFSVAPDREEAELLARILADDGPCEVDPLWEDDVLVLVPVKPLPAGERLVLSFTGQLQAADGRTFTVSHEVPFFVETRGPRPRLLSVSPADGASCGTTTPLVFEFSAAMDGESFREGFSLVPAAQWTAAWTAGGTTVSVSPSHHWENLAIHAWEVEGTVRDGNGVALGCAHSGCFVTQQDPDPPALLALRPAEARPDGSFLAIDAPLDGNLRARDCICMSFSEDVEMQSLCGAFGLDPPVSGHLVRESAGLFYFVPGEPWLRGRRQRLVISADLEDLSGNRMGEEVSEWFLPGIPAQQVVSLEANASGSLPLGGGPVDVALAPGSEVVFVVAFAEPYGGDLQAEVPFKVRCEAVFPSSLPGPSLRAAAWTTAFSLTLIYGGFTASAGIELHYYRLTLPGGQDGIPTEEGSFLEEDAWVVLVAR
jgi:hypothetical protein